MHFLIKLVSFSKPITLIRENINDVDIIGYPHVENKIGPLPHTA